MEVGFFLALQTFGGFTVYFALKNQEEIECQFKSHGWNEDVIFGWTDLLKKEIQCKWQKGRLIQTINSFYNIINGLYMNEYFEI